MTISRELHPSEEGEVRFFEVDHLPDPLKCIVASCESLAHTMISSIESDPELTVGLRKLLEAKDCFVRAKVAELNRANGNTEGSPIK